ncbi:mannose-1-phosphate guanylyltransferase/mannose-6-phosphate isomerase [Terasakiella pusilla]|uniref:mannose-1-phosphate guanylyltransferase/mannose-6-phosphate isomerase n=1 Tax=Terasakiella pusilla TaxID=64973 RepID=UPI003AA82B96
MSKPKPVIKPVLLSGGSGQRLWPLSRSHVPKQFLPLYSQKPMIIETALRVQGPEFSSPIVICNEQHRFLIASMFQQAEIKTDRIVLEPEGKNTAPAAALAALMALQECPDEDAVVLLMPSDHFISDEGSFQATVLESLNAALAGNIVTFGIKPTRPETGYGYIKVNTDEQVYRTYPIHEFVEKPDRETASYFLESGNYYWNSGIFLFSAKLLLSEFARYAPEVLQVCEDAIESSLPDLDFIRLQPDAYKTCISASLDCAIMEKTDRAVVMPANFRGWNDLGSWNALWELNEKDQNNNTILGDVIAEGASNSLVYSEDGALTAVLGIDGLIVVNTGDVVFVGKRNCAQDVKKIVEKLSEANREEHLFHSIVYRPWGHYRTLARDTCYLIKEIEVSPGASLSTQYHNHRAEHWVVIEGSAYVHKDEDRIVVNPNESVFIPQGAVHRLINKGDQPLRLIEVQTGTYLSEDDIVRLEDNYGRAT